MFRVKRDVALRDAWTIVTPNGYRHSLYKSFDDAHLVAFLINAGFDMSDTDLLWSLDSPAPKER